MAPPGARPTPAHQQTLWIHPPPSRRPSRPAIARARPPPWARAKSHGHRRRTCLLRTSVAALAVQDDPTGPQPGGDDPASASSASAARTCSPAAPRATSTRLSGVQVLLVIAGEATGPTAAALLRAATGSYREGGDRSAAMRSSAAGTS